MAYKTDKGHWRRALCSEKKIQNGIVGALHDSKFQNLSSFAVFLPVRSVHRDAFRPRSREHSLAKKVWWLIEKMILLFRYNV